MRRREVEMDGQVGHVPYRVVVGQVLRVIRNLFGVSQEDAAHAVGRSQSMWSKIERGESPVSVEQLARFVAFLDRSPRDEERWLARISMVSIFDLVERSVSNLQTRGLSVTTKEVPSGLEELDVNEVGKIVHDVAMEPMPPDVLVQDGAL